MKKLVVILAALFVAAAHAADEYLGLYLQGNKIGYTSYMSRPDMLGNRKVNRADSKMMVNVGLLSQEMQISVEGTTWTDPAGHPLKMLSLMTSAGRTQKVVAFFKLKTAEIDIENGGQKTHKSLPLPNGAIVDDPLSLMVGTNVKPGTRKVIYVLDPTTVTFLKNEVVVVGMRSTTVKNKSVRGTLIQILSPQGNSDVYLNAKGGLIKMDGPLGIEMLPETRAVALANNSTKYKPSADLAFASSLKTDKAIDDPEAVTGLTLRISGRDLSKLPSDEHQTVKKEGARWIIDVHPPVMASEPGQTIAQVRAEKPQWLRPSLHIPSDSNVFKDLSASIVKDETQVLPAAVAIKDYVTKQMHPNAGIGVLRDATEVLSSKEGVCRDYAILTATLMRSAGIPARLASGVVNWQGDFYYHAWVEIWDGSKWIGIDSTVTQKQMSAVHVKLADGNVEDAFAFTFLDKVKIEVLDVRRK